MMGYKRSIFLGVVAIAGISSFDIAIASEFDKCVLQHMQGVTSDFAAASVKESCLRTVETQLPDDAFKALAVVRSAFGQMPSYVGGFGLYITLNNNTGYTITELIIAVEDKKTHIHVPYIVREFPFAPPPGVIVVGPPRDLTLLKTIRPGQREFCTPINETTRDLKEWGNSYGWSRISAKGFRD